MRAYNRARSALLIGAIIFFFCLVAWPTFYVSIYKRDKFQNYPTIVGYSHLLFSGLDTEAR